MGRGGETRALTFAKTLRQNMTDAERLLWRHLRGHRLAGSKFKRQQPIGPYIADFVDLAARLIIEADGGQHDESAHDAKRDAWLISQGFRVLRFWNNEILGNTEAVLEAILTALERVRPLSPPPLPRGERGSANAHSDHLAHIAPLAPRGRGVGGEGETAANPPAEATK